MKRTIIRRTVAALCLFAGIGTVKLSAQSAADTLALTLENALEIAMSENLTIRVADREIEKQQYAKKGTYADLFPQIDLQGSYQRTIEKQTMYMDGVPGMNTGIKVGRDNLWTGGVNVGVPLVSAPLWNSLKISGYDVELAVEKARSSRIEMRDQVQQAFYSVLLAEDARGVFQEAYNNALENYNDTKRKFDHDLASEYDVIRANVNLKNAEPNLYDAENSIILALWQLKALLGLDVEMNIKCVGNLTDYQDMLMSQRAAEDLSLGNNSQLKQIDIQKEQLGKVRKMQISQYYPSLSAQFSYQWISMNNNFKMGKYRWDPYSVVGLQLNIPVFSGGKRLSEVKKTNVSLEQLDMQRLDAERMLKVAVKQSNDQMATCAKQFSAAKEGVAEAERGYDITMVRYKTGEGTILDINDSQLQLTQARLNLNQSIYNYMVALSTLEKTLGNTNE